MGAEKEEVAREAFRRAGVGPFILGKLKAIILSAEEAKKLLAETPPENAERIKYLQHVVEEGERVKPIYESCLKRLKEAEEELKAERHRRLDK